MSTKLTKTDTNKRAMISALESTLGIVSNACRKVDIARQTHYEWMREDEQYKEDVESINELAIDFAESALHSQIREGNSTSTIFYLKTKGKKRGFVEKTEVEHSGEVGATVTMFELPSNDRDK